jgi:hypothetical protein
MYREQVIPLTTNLGCLESSTLNRPGIISCGPPEDINGRSRARRPRKGDKRRERIRDDDYKRQSAGCCFDLSRFLSIIRNYPDPRI